jgi:hypothetical protein
MARITEKMLEARIEKLNKMTNYSFNFQLEMAYGGYSLSKYEGSVTLFNSGYTSRRQLFDLICAYMDGIDLGIELSNMS